MKRVKANGALIKQKRDQLEGLSTQKEFAHAIQVSERKLRQIENENDYIYIRTLDKIASVLKVDRESLIMKDDVVPPKVAQVRRVPPFWYPQKRAKPDTTMKLRLRPWTQEN